MVKCVTGGLARALAPLACSPGLAPRCLPFCRVVMAFRPWFSGTWLHEAGLQILERTWLLRDSIAQAGWLTFNPGNSRALKSFFYLPSVTATLGCQSRAEFWSDVTFRRREDRRTGASLLRELLPLSGAGLAQGPETEGGASCLLWLLIGQ